MPSLSDEIARRIQKPTSYPGRSRSCSYVRPRSVDLPAELIDGVAIARICGAGGARDRQR